MKTCNVCWCHALSTPPSVLLTNHKSTVRTRDNVRNVKVKETEARSSGTIITVTCLGRNDPKELTCSVLNIFPNTFIWSWLNWHYLCKIHGHSSHAHIYRERKQVSSVYKLCRQDSSYFKPHLFPIFCQQVPKVLTQFEDIDEDVFSVFIAPGSQWPACAFSTNKE